MAIVDDSARAKVAAALAGLSRTAFAFPPDHGGRVVATILGDPALRLDWQAEVEEMRTRVATNRRDLAQALRAATGSDRFGFIAGQQGMFSLLPLDGAQVERLRAEFGIYMLWDGRTNMAGLNTRSVPVLADAIGRVVR
jgi:aromatic-amino-acid transaminase